MILELLRSEGIDESLIRGVEAFRSDHPVDGSVSARVPVPRYPFYGKDAWEEALTALLCGENLLLVGPKATGKNVFAECLAAAFARPLWDVSLHVNADADSLVGADTFADGAVAFREGPVCRCARMGGFGVLDEINMAKNEAIAVLHATLDHRRAIDVPGYGRVQLDPATRFIATMNHGYAGTRELNEALASRFMVIAMPRISERNLSRLIAREFPSLRKKYADQFVALFLEIDSKCANSEVSTRSLDLRGLLSAIRLAERGLDAARALEIGIVNKSFDEFERSAIADVIAARVPRGRLFGE